VYRYTRGVQGAGEMRKTWAGLSGSIDADRYAQVSAFLAIQEKEAKWWRDACIAYFQTFSHRPIPAGFAPPEKTLEEYEAMSFPYAPGNPGRTAAPFKDK
jgi:alpha-glucuronidase